MAFVLYLITGIVTAVPVVYALGWAVWGAPVSITEYISLVGSLLLSISAFISLTERRIAARIALVAITAIWSFYLPAITGMFRAKSSDQRLALYVLKWTPSDQPFTVSNSVGNSVEDLSLTSADVELLKATGITGTIATFSVGNYGNGNKRSKVVLVIQHPVSAPAELPEPNASTVIYVQRGSNWQRYPSNVPTLKRTIRIEPWQEDPNQVSIMVELASGARQGLSVWWPESETEKP